MSKLSEGIRNISPATTFSFGVLVAVITVVIYFKDTDAERRLQAQAISLKVEAVIGRLDNIDAKLEDRWTRGEQRTFAAMLREMNRERGLVVPSVER